MMMSDPPDREPVDQSTIDCWRENYGLDKRTPAEAEKWWIDSMRGLAPSGCVAALGVALDELDALRKDAERYRWLVTNTSHHLYNSAWIGSLTAVKYGPCDILSADEVPALIDAEIDRRMARKLAVGAA
jgi:hypothetical protein